MRGKVGLCLGGAGACRITPACAGKRVRWAVKRLAGRDHPRVCGEKAYSLVINGSEWGSPPRVRGKASGWPAVRSKPRITPACAGKRGRGRRTFECLWDHPRVCGEKVRGYVKIWNEWGSPPRVRGKVYRFPVTMLSPGITPACAGKRKTARQKATAHGDHPRVCGEKTRSVFTLNKVQGSPPRVRGKGGRWPEP